MNTPFVKFFRRKLPDGLIDNLDFVRMLAGLTLAWFNGLPGISDAEHGAD